MRPINREDQHPETSSITPSEQLPQFVRQSSLVYTGQCDLMSSDGSKRVIHLTPSTNHLPPAYTLYPVVLVVQLFGVGLMIERSLVRLPAGSQVGQLGLPSLRGR